MRSTCNCSSTISLNCFVTVCSDYDIALACVFGLTRIHFVEYVQHTFYTFVTFVLLIIMCMYILLVHKTKAKNVKMKKNIVINSLKNIKLGDVAWM